MNKERAAEIEFLRGELVGPARPLEVAQPATMVNLDSQGCFRLTEEADATLYYQYNNSMTPQEIVHYRGETPMQRYGAGLLHPRNDLSGVMIDKSGNTELPGNETASHQPDATASVETIQAVVSDPDDQPSIGYDSGNETHGETDADDFEVSSDDMNQPSVMGLSFCLEEREGEFVVSLPQ
ncbi:hypothetical protein D9980_19505 [Serratia sp. 3ACOL1]|uniref:hypothetical protein n=1 Tax=Serratia sp. 3ACOL1 TaxID=2448483 RepID=UPI000EF4EE03|nr:hypothetical protein [Serratia sp. 3ACOL1]AYM92576.1 hypothetical protein D9980_19505 [Serratia sp. 3ACOL1]